MIERETASLALLRKSIRVSPKRRSIFNVLCFGFWTQWAKKNRVMNREVNIEETIPMIKVKANPLIGPESKLSKMIAAMIVVKLESTIALNAFR